MNTSKYSQKALLIACWWGIFEVQQHDNPYESTLVINECCLVLAWCSKTILTCWYPKNSSKKEPISWLATLSKTSSMNGNNYCLLQINIEFQVLGLFHYPHIKLLNLHILRSSPFCNM
jgi:hypothetical protein